MASEGLVLFEPQGCSAPELYEPVTSYCFGQVDEGTRRIVEAHLHECWICQRQTVRFKAVIDILRHDPALMNPLSHADIAAVFGLSAKIHLPFGGHWWLVVVSCVLYALLYVSTLWIEIGLQLDRYAKGSAKGSPIIFALMFVTTYVSLKFCWRRVVQGTPALIFSFLVLLAPMLVAYGLSWWILPREPVNGASNPQQIVIQSYNCFLALITICLLIPFHFVLSVQRELFEGKHRAIFLVLKRDKSAAVPRGSIYLPMWFPLTLLIMQAYTIVTAQFRFFDMIPPGGYRTFYITLWAISWFAFYAFGVGWLAWYYWTLNELKRECLIAERFLSVER